MYRNNINKLFYSLSFVSLVSPFIKNKLFLLTNLQLSKDSKKAYLKQSYLILTWLYYLSFLNNKLKKKKIIKVFVSPSKKRIFTVTKAPIAHKNWSKEQYFFGYYNFKVSIQGVFYPNFKNKLIQKKNKIEKLSQSSVSTVKQSVVFFLITKNYFPKFETNIFFLKNYTSYLSFSDFFFFNYYYFSKKKLIKIKK